MKLLKKIRHIVEITCTIRLFSSVISSFWVEVVLVVVNLINKITYSHISRLSPYENLYDHLTNYSSLRFG